jgi:hypothetical protein
MFQDLNQRRIIQVYFVAKSSQARGSCLPRRRINEVDVSLGELVMVGIVESFLPVSKRRRGIVERWESWAVPTSRQAPLNDGTSLVWNPPLNRITAGSAKAAVAERRIRLGDAWDAKKTVVCDKKRRNTAKSAAFLALSRLQFQAQWF